MSRKQLFVLGLSLIVCFVTAERIRYDNYKVYKAVPQTIEQVRILEELDGRSDSLIFLNGVAPRGESYIVVAPHKQPDFMTTVNQNGIAYELVEKNLQRQLDIEMENTPKYRAVGYDWKSYHLLEETYNWLEQLFTNYSVVKIISAGQTYEGREIKGVKVSYGPDRQGIFIEGGIHAREWIAPAVVTYFLNELLTSSDPAVREIAERYDWYFVPHANPDGYVYTHERDRLWRKTRSKNGACYGADPNRNWGFHWNEVGASNQPCSETYAGKYAFSEIETSSLSEFITSLEGIKVYIAFHSYSQLLLFPYGHTKQHANNHDDLQKIGDAAGKALAQRYGTRFTVGNIYETIYPASGASPDWAYGVLDVPLTYTYELRPTASSWNGFILPPEQIIPSGLETTDSLVELFKQARKLNYLD